MKYISWLGWWRGFTLPVTPPLLYLMHVQTMKTFNKGWIVSPPPTVHFCVPMSARSADGGLSLSARHCWKAPPRIPISILMTMSRLSRGGTTAQGFRANRTTRRARLAIHHLPSDLVSDLPRLDVRRLRSCEADGRRGDQKQTLSRPCRKPAVFHAPASPDSLLNLQARWCVEALAQAKEVRGRDGRKSRDGCRTR